MRWILLLSILLLTSCAPSPMPTPSVRQKYLPDIDAFKTNAQCPNICWLGIHPGTTSSNDALRVISSSTEFNQNFTEQTVSSIQAYWFPDNTKTFGSNVRLNIKDGLVYSIDMGPLTPFTVMDVLGLWGEPNEISLRLDKGLHDETFSVYSLYYSSLKTKILVSPGSLTGPNPMDFIKLLEINVEFGNEQRQPWLGYGRLQDYSSGTVTTATVVPTP